MLHFTFSSPDRIPGRAELQAIPLGKHSPACPLCASTVQLLLDLHILPKENFYHLPGETSPFPIPKRGRRPRGSGQ